MLTNKLIWADINRVIPNPKNPRKDPNFKSKEMKHILKTKGFEEAIVAYKSGPFYCILSGHRRWQASQSLGLKEIPIYLVPEPKNTLEELERLGSIQGNQTDWSPYEWITHTINLFENDLNSKIENIAIKLSESIPTIKKRIAVGKFYERNEIEVQLNNNTYSVNMLDTIRLWCMRVKKFHPDLYHDLGEKYIKEIMLRKFENKCLHSEILKGNYIEKATQNELMTFLFDPNKKISTFIQEVNLLNNTTKNYDVKTNVSIIKKATKNITGIKYNRKNEASKILEEIRNLENQVETLLKKLNSN
ncbi:MULTISPECIES: ParB/RepB/Spo0J family partition protein [unclassified Lysinibacillus]|uniref:ParB/RepB/Spo0J family partition protein n=1 Tax=unclassified Lysinibacillus TaxID=2636778 RepID=UPI00372D43FA